MYYKTTFRNLVLAAPLVVLAGCVGDLSTDPVPVGEAQQGDNQVESLYTANADTVTAVSESDTAQITTEPEFDFSTSDAIQVSLDIAEARDEEATVSICTEYEPGGTVFDINYDSCLVRAPLVNGLFEHEMSLTNQFDSVIAVVWFQDPAIEPISREFTRSDAVGYGGLNNRLVW